MWLPESGRHLVQTVLCMHGLYVPHIHLDTVEARELLLEILTTQVSHVETLGKSESDSQDMFSMLKLSITQCKSLCIFMLFVVWASTALLYTCSCGSLSKPQGFVTAALASTHMCSSLHHDT